MPQSDSSLPPVPEPEVAPICQPPPQSLELALANVGEAVIIASAQGTVSFINPVAEMLTGWPTQTAIGQPLSDIFRLVGSHSEQRTVFPLEGELPLDRGAQVVLLAKEGTECPIEYRALKSRDQSAAPAGTILIFRDITERKQSEELQARLAAIVESSEDAIISKSLTGIIRTWNAGAMRIFGYSAEEVVGRSITLLIPEDRQGEEQEILAKIGRGERVEHFETLRRAKDGRLIPISLMISPIFDQAGQIVGASKIARDITERRDAESELRKISRRKDRFIALLAHELRNPLAPLRNGLYILQHAGNDESVAAQAREMMERQLSHMVRLIDDLLDISRVTQNKIVLRRSQILLEDVIHQAVEAVTPAIEAAGHQFLLSLPAEPIFLHADLTRLIQVFNNLLMNSIKYMAPGGTIQLTALREKQFVVISVKDSGIGISPESLPHLFEMFSQVDRDSEYSKGGLGIGLALVKAIVEIHEGSISATSGGIGLGSTFTVRLPTLKNLGETLCVSASQQVSQTSNQEGQLRILVTDDNRDAALSLAMSLTLLGHDVRTAHDGLAAISLAEAFRPHVIFMDLGMPRLGGAEAVKRIRQTPIGREIIIVALTGWGQETYRELSKTAGCDHHFVKPVDLAAVQRILQQAQEVKSAS